MSGALTTRKSRDANGGRVDYCLDGELALRLQAHHSAGVLQQFSVCQPSRNESGNRPLEGWVLLAPNAPIWASRMHDALRLPSGTVETFRLPGPIVARLGRDEYGRVIAEGPSDGRSGYAGTQARLHVDTGACRSMLADLARWCEDRQWTSAAVHTGLLAEHEGSDLSSALTRSRLLSST